MFALPVRQIFLLVDEAECHRREDESDIQQHDRVVDPLDGYGVSSVVEMLSKRTVRVRNALRRGRGFGEIGAGCQLIRLRLPERYAVRVYARLRGLGDLGAREIQERQHRHDSEEPDDENEKVLPAVSAYGRGRHRRFLRAEGDDRSRRGAGGFAEEDEDDDGDEGDEESLEVEKDVLEQHQWTREPGVAPV